MFIKKLLLISLVMCSSCSMKESVLFVDNFDQGNDLPDSTVWSLCTYGNCAWAQHFKEVKGYENVRIEEGILKLRATKIEDTYKNGGIRLKKGFPGNSRLEVKARLNKLVKGAFPAIWQMPIGAPGWPKGGEVDLMEWIQSTPKQIYQTVHTYYINGETGSAGVTNPNPAKDFDVTQYHVYAADRTTDAVIFYVDGKETFRYENQNLPKEQLQFPFCDYPYDIILNYSLGGELNGNPTWAGPIDDNDLPGEMWIDWVKVTSLE